MVCNDITTGISDDRGGYLSLIIAMAPYDEEKRNIVDDPSTVDIEDDNVAYALIAKVGIATGKTIKPVTINEVTYGGTARSQRWGVGEQITAVMLKDVSDKDVCWSDESNCPACPELYHKNLAKIVEWSRTYDLPYLCVYWYFPPSYMIGYAELLIRSILQDGLVASGLTGFFVGDELQITEQSPSETGHPSSCTGPGSSEIFIHQPINSDICADVCAYVMDTIVPLIDEQFDQANQILFVVNNMTSRGNSLEEIIDWCNSPNEARLPWSRLNPEVIDTNTLLEYIDKRRTEMDRLTFLSELGLIPPR
jgi:hypothetical protein